MDQATVQIILAIVVLGFGVISTSLAWIMNTLFQLRREISADHATFRANLASHAGRLARLEEDSHTA